MFIYYKKYIYYIIMSNGNTRYGERALSNNTTIDGLNSAFGSDALRDNTNKWNTLVGAYAGLVNNGESNTGIGTNALLQNTSGNYNTALGTAALCFNIDGSLNTAVGSNAMANPTNATGSENTALGTQAGYNNSGNKNTFLGAQTDATASYHQSTAIGYGSQIAESNQIVIGTSAETIYIQGGFNWKVGTTITGSISLSHPLSQFYTVAMSSANQIITLPEPNATTLLGETVTFKRISNATEFTLAAGSGTPFIPFNSITATLGTTVATNRFQMTLVCNGTHWCVINTT